MNKPMILTNIAALTDTGMVRANNEDVFLIADPDTATVLENTCRLVRGYESNSLLLVVSDGMGGYEGGEIASRLTANAILTELAKLPKQLFPQSRLEAAMEEANRLVLDYNQAHPQLKEMGATATVVLIEKDIAYVGMVGDSRAYIIRDGRIKQLTRDQTVGQALIDIGKLTPETAAHNRFSSALLQAIGVREYLQVAVSTIQLQAGDYILLCSDGLSGKLQANEIKTIIETYGAIEAAVHMMVEEAKQRGGEDNITVILAKFSGTGLQTKVQTDTTLTNQIRILHKFDTTLEVEAKAKREVRKATFQDWLNTAVLAVFARDEAQRAALAALAEFGDYIILRKGDILVSQGEEPCESHYWLVDGRYRVMVERADKKIQTVAFLVSPLDQRRDHEIKGSEAMVHVKRQFFTASLAMLKGGQRNATIRCEDEQNILIRIPFELFQRVAAFADARYLGRDNDLGSIEVGKVADLVVLDNNPLANIRNTDSVKFVIKNGEMFEAGNMDKVWPTSEPRKPFAWQR